VAAVLLCRAVVESGATLAELAAAMPKFPQAKTNVRALSKALPQRLLDDVEQVNRELEGRGRVLVRRSGTEPVVRILAEAESEQEASILCGRIERLVLEKLG
jgi:phosphoglucosamine mutase